MYCGQMGSTFHKQKFSKLPTLVEHPPQNVHTMLSSKPCEGRGDNTGYEEDAQSSMDMMTLKQVGVMPSCPMTSQLGLK